MAVVDALKRLSYRGRVRSAVRALGLHNLLRRHYYALVRPRDGILPLEIGGIRARFFVRTPGELRLLDQRMQPDGELRTLESLIAVLRAGDVVYDVGAHVGLYTVLLAKAVGAQGLVIAFEPGSQAHEHLRDNLRLNGLTNVRPMRIALGGLNTQARLYFGDENADASLIRPPAGAARGHEVVDVVQGDRLAATEDWPTPRLVKIDVEGAEYTVLQGLRQTLSRPECELVACEVHPHLLPTGVQPADVLVLLHSLGFERIDKYPIRRTFHALCAKTFSSSAGVVPARQAYETL